MYPEFDNEEIKDIATENGAEPLCPEFEEELFNYVK